MQAHSKGQRAEYVADGGGAVTAAPEEKDTVGAAGSGEEAVPVEEEQDAGSDGGSTAEQPTPARHITLRTKMEENAFDINTTPCDPRGLWAVATLEETPVCRAPSCGSPRRPEPRRFARYYTTERRSEHWRHGSLR